MQNGIRRSAEYADHRNSILERLSSDDVAASSDQPRMRASVKLQYLRGFEVRPKTFFEILARSKTLVHLLGGVCGSRC